MPQHSPRSRDKAGPTPGVEQVGEPGFNTWHHWSPKMRIDLVIDTDPLFLYCQLLEADPSCRGYEIKSEQHTWVNGEKITSRFDCVVTRAPAGVDFVDVKAHDLHGADASEADQKQERKHRLIAEANGARYVRVYRADLEKQRTWLSSVKRGVAALGAARFHSLVLSDTHLFALFAQKPQWHVGEFFEQFERSERGLAEASLFAAIFSGRITSDMAQRPFWRATRLVVASSTSRPAEVLREAEPPAEVDLDMQELLLEAAAQEQVPRPTAAHELLAQDNRLSPPLTADDEWRQRFDLASIPAQYRNPADWPKTDPQPPGSKKAARIDKYRAAIEAVFKRANVTMVAQEQGLHRSELYRELRRALALHPDGQIWGWRAVGTGAHVVPWTRKTPIPSGLQVNAAGYAGAFRKLLKTYPDIQAALLALALKQQGPERKIHEARINATDLCTEFHRLCVEAGIAITEYPFNTDDQGLRSVRRFLHAARAADFETGARILGGVKALVRSRTGTGIESLIAASVPFEVVMQDGHKIDFLGSIGIPHPSGMRFIPMNRVSIEVVIESVSKAILARRLVFRSAADSGDALRALFDALSRWVPLPQEDAAFPFPEGAGLPSGLIPELEGAAWSTLLMDNASIYTAQSILHQARPRIGCAVNFGPVGDFTRRYIIEGVFSVLAKRGFQRMPSTTGSHPRDTRREDAEQKAKTIPYDELAYVVDVAIASYNAAPKPSLAHRSPLQYLKEMYSGPAAPLIPRYLPPLASGVPEMNITRVDLTIRGDQKGGRRPHVNYLGVEYTSALINRTAKLIGTAVVAHVKGDDLRSFELFLPGGGSLGFVTADDGWNRILHNVQQRRAILKLQRTRNLVRQPGEDWVQAYLRAIATRASQSHDKGQQKVSTAAGEAAHTAHHSGLEMPKVDEEQAVRELLPMDPPERGPGEPAFKRKVRY